ncbi:MAG: 50S ribosomal protein L25/general stress protein Ctc [Alphaproteobacteria bacterium]|nr:50S ribosomal protein L25/general stress protein Ctc [Alphaproteobacteria bacterium]
MTQVTVLAAQARESVGKGTARALRRNEEVPAVIYGDKTAPMAISMTLKLLLGYVNKAAFFTTLFDVDIDGKKHRVLPRDVQFHPVSDRPLHVDFLRVSPSTKVRVQVPVHFLNTEKCPGIKRGGTLNIVHHEIEVLCSPSQIPVKFDINLEGYAIGTAVHLSAIELPKGVTYTSKETDYTIAAIAVPSALRGAVEAEAAATPAAAAPAAGKAAAGKAAAPAAAAKPAAKKK